LRLARILGRKLFAQFAFGRKRAPVYYAKRFFSWFLLCHGAILG
jgi:hypothetical protein